MSLTLYAHPFSSYCQKVLIALYENQTPFTMRLLEDEASRKALAQLWPIARFPVLVDDAQVIPEATTIIEHLGLHHPGPVRLLPQDPKAALKVRAMDRFFDNYISTPQQAVVSNALRPETAKDPMGEANAKALLETAYGWLNEAMAGREWATDAGFSLADCGAAPFLFYADWTHPIAPRFAHVRDYRSRLLARASVARAVDEARPYRPYFPLGAPDRD
jgi:glutathione S-transferase